MEHSTRRSGGWTFLLTGGGGGGETKTKNNTNTKNSKISLNLSPEMIGYEEGECQLFDSKALMEWTEQIQCMNGEDVNAYLKILPPINQLVRAVPKTLGLLDAIYKKCELVKNRQNSTFPGEQLKVEDLMHRLIWWYAHAEQEQQQLNNGSGKVSLKQNVSNNNRPITGSQWTKLEQLHFSDHVRAILGVMHRQCGHVIEEAQADRQQIVNCLEALGCHGLVNCASGLIRLNDAVHFELVRHAERLKLAFARHKEIAKQKAVLGPVPSKAGHQRQMNLRLTEICDRLKQNEATTELLEELLNTQHLSSLLRIVRKRVQSDKLMLSLYQAFVKATPGDFALREADPIIAKLIVAFKNAYDKLLALAPAIETDSGCGIDDSDDFDCPSTPETVEDPPPKKTDQKLSLIPFVPLPTVVASPKKLNRIANGPAAQKRNRFRNPSASANAQPPTQHHRSLSAFSRSSISCDQIDLPPRIGRIKSVKSLSNLLAKDPTKKSSSPLLRRRRHPTPNMRNGSDYALGGGEIDQGEMIRLRIQISDVSDELRQARHKIAQLQKQNAAYRSLPAPDYPGSQVRRPSPDSSTTNNNNPLSKYSSLAELDHLVERFATLFVRDRHEIMRTLDDLPEFRGSEELQLKTMFTVIVLTYRSVSESVQRRRERIWALLDESDHSASDRDARLDDALFAHMYRRAKSDHGMANAREVTAQIWKTLYDFPSLKTCTRFNRFILECVAVVWDLVAGIEGRPPRIQIEYESCQFDPTRHQRSHRASQFSTVIKSYLWPSLIDCDTNRILFKGIVIT